MRIVWLNGVKFLEQCSVHANNLINAAVTLILFKKCKVPNKVPG